MQQGLAWAEVIALLTLGGGIMTAGVVHARWLLSRIRESDAAREVALREAHARIDEVHQRINSVRERYVRRDDLKEHIERIESGQAEMRTVLDEVRASVLRAEGRANG